MVASVPQSERLARTLKPPLPKGKGTGPSVQISLAKFSQNWNRKKVQHDPFSVNCGGAGGGTGGGACL